VADPALPAGIGSEVQIDQANRWMRVQPWYQQLLQAWGQNPNAVHLNDAQQQQLLTEARARGVGISDRHEIDPAGNINPKGHKLRNTLIVAGIAGAALTAGAAAGAFGAGGASAGGASAAGAGATAGGLGGAAVPLTAASFPGVTAGLGTAGATGMATGGGWLGTAKTIANAYNRGRNVFDTAGQIGDAFGAASSGRAQGRKAEADINQSQDRNAMDLYRSQISANNNENNFGMDRYTGGLAAARDANTFGMNRFTGGLDQARDKNNFAINRVNAGINLADADLNRRKYALTAPGMRASNAVRGDVLAHAQDASISGLPSGISVPTINGGLRPSMFSDNTRALGGELSSQALQQQQAGDHFAPLPDLPNYEGSSIGMPEYQGSSVGMPDYVKPPPAPGLSGVPQSTGLDSFLNTAATIGNLSKLMPGYRKPVNPNDPYANGNAGGG
jgi:hypothetical protein